MMTNNEPNLLDITRRHLRQVMSHVALVSFFINLLILPVSIYSLQVFDRVMSTGSMATLGWLTFIMLLLFVGASMLQALRGKMLLRAADWLQETLMAQTIARSLSIGAQAQANKSIQPLRDVQALKQFLGGNGLITLVDAPWAVLYIGVLFMIHFSLGMTITLGALMLLSLNRLNESVMGAPVKKAGGLQLKSLQELELAARNAEIIEAMGMTRSIGRRWESGQRAASGLYAQAGERSADIQGISKFVRLSLQIFVTCLSAILALDGQITMGAIIAASILANRALAPLESAIAGWKSLADTRAAYGRLQQLFNQPARAEGMELPVPRGDLALEQVSYAIAGRREPIVRGVDFVLPAGEMLGIIGDSGSGKSTLARLITGVWKPNVGQVRLDGADVYHWPRESFGRHVGYLPQDVELFGGSVKDNIARMSDDPSPDAIVRAAQLARAHELILRLPNGYDTDIGPQGAALSAGQKQRIALARAFFGAPKLLILDEPDANLDEAGQQALLDALAQAKRDGITSLIITHRRTMLGLCDKLLLMRDGMVSAFGPTANVIASLNQRPALHMAKQ